MIKSLLLMLMKSGGALPLLLLPFLISGCMTVRPPAELKFTSGAVIETLSGNVSLSYATPDRSNSGSGIIMYRKPDQIRVVILSPFGSVLQEVYLSGELVTIVDAGNGIAFRGSCNDLPDKGDFSGWRYIHWLIDIDPPEPSLSTYAVERINRFGHPEKAFFENGLLISKSTAAGGKVSYGKYTAVNGAPFPLEIIYETVAKERFTILFEDPETNVPFADGTFIPDLGKLNVYPLSSLK